VVLKRVLCGTASNMVQGCPPKGSVGRSGASCLVCGSSVLLSYIREAARGGGLGSQLLCTVADGGRKRLYLSADSNQISAADVPRLDSVPETDIPYISGIFNTPIYGIDKHWKLFTNKTTYNDEHLQRPRVGSTRGSHARRRGAGIRRRDPHVSGTFGGAPGESLLRPVLLECQTPRMWCRCSPGKRSR
jgi:hypothetical protein